LSDAEQKFVYITGCDTGFGRIAVDLFDKLSAWASLVDRWKTCWLTGRKCADYGVFAGVFLEQTMTDLPKQCPSGNVVPVRLDVTSESSVELAAAFIVDHLASIPGAQLVALCNNAYVPTRPRARAKRADRPRCQNQSGILVQPCPAEWQSAKDFKDMFNVNVLGAVLVTNSVLPLIRKSMGRIVVTASIAGRIGIATQAAYCASKFAVEAWADVLRKDMYPFGVTVHIVEPGVFPNTGLYARFQTGECRPRHRGR